MIEILFFADLQEAVGKNKITIDDSNITVKELKDKWLRKYNLPTLDRAMIAVNEEYASEDAIVHKGDIVAFIPPVSGG